MRWSLLALLAMGVGCGGCVLPLPHLKQTCVPIDGTVVDGRTNAPIERAEVNAFYPDGHSRKTLTDKDGKFRFPPKYSFHWGILFGVALNHCLSNDGWHGSHGFSAISVEAERYDPVWFSGGSLRMYADGLPETHEPFRKHQKIEPAVERHIEPGSDAGATKWTYPAISLPRAGREDANHIP